MKKIQQSISFLIFLFIALSSYAQQEWNAAGVWTGKLYNDTTKKYIPFEIAISYHNGKYGGYTYTIFVIDSIENIGVKEVTIKEKNDLFIIKDKKLVDDNYKDAPAKGVYTTLELQRSENDTADILSGRWFTNKTREYYPLTGTVTVTKRKNIFATRIVPKLRQLGLADDLSFFTYSFKIENTAKNEKVKADEHQAPKDTMMTIVEPPLVINVPKSKTKELKMPDADVLKGVVDSIVPKTINSNAGVPTRNETKPTAKEPEIITADQQVDRNNDQPVVTTKPVNQPKQETRSVVQKMPKDTTWHEILTTKKVLEDEHSAQNLSGQRAQNPTSDVKKPADVEGTRTEIIPQKNVQVTEKPAVVTEKISQKKDTFAAVTSQLLQPLAPVKIDLSDRKIETIRTVPVIGDSLVLSLFDNGAVDGDTVSVLLNGQVVVSKVGLLEKAFNHTIHLTPDMGDSIKIVLYAENLGSIPPNTGLLVVRNGGQDYEIRFSGDLKKNSAIILLRNRKQ